MILYDDVHSPNCRKVHALAANLQIPLDRITLSVLKGHTRRVDFLRLNSNGKVPVLVDRSLVLPESNAILVYLAQQVQSKLWPTGCSAQAVVLQWMFWQSSGMSGAIAKVGFERLIKPRLLSKKGEESVAAAAMQDFLPLARVLESRLSQCAFVANDVSVADFALGAWMDVARDAGMLEGFTATNAWLERLGALQGWDETALQWGGTSN